MVYFGGSYDYMYGTLAQKLHPYYTFYYHTIAFSIGALMARYKCHGLKKNNMVLIAAVALIFLVSFIPAIRVLAKIAYPFFLTAASFSSSVLYFSIYYIHFLISYSNLNSADFPLNHFSFNKDN